MDGSSFKPGDVVQLKSGGPKMTVQMWDETYEQFYCVWFDDKHKQQGQNFATEVLKLYESTPISAGRRVERG